MQSAEAGNQAALNEVEIAELSLHEYTEGTFIRENAQAMIGIKRADVELVAATQIVDWGKQWVLKGLITPPEHGHFDHWYEAASREHQLANGIRNTLVTVEKARDIRRLKAEVEQCRAEQQNAEAILELERTRESHLRGKLDRFRTQKPKARRPSPTLPRSSPAAPGLRGSGAGPHRPEVNVGRRNRTAGNLGLYA